VYAVLTNPIYTGYSVWDEILQKGKHAQIVDVATFEQVQEHLAKCSRKSVSNRHAVPALPAATLV
jgi:hypothetical protein